MPLPPAPLVWTVSAEALDHVGFSGSGLVLQGDEKATFMDFVEVVVVPRPGIDVHDAGWSQLSVADMSDAVGKNHHATETIRQFQPALIVRARRGFGFLAGSGHGLKENQKAQEARCRPESRSQRDGIRREENRMHASTDWLH